MRSAHILMCPPDYFGIEYEINPWMNRRCPVDHDRAMQQWTALRNILEDVGATVSTLQPLPGTPDLVFTANAALIFHRRAILSNFRHPQRQHERPINEQWLRKRGFEVEELPSDIAFEGAGDALFCGDTLFAGYHIRSDATGQQQVAQSLGHRVIPVPLIDDYYYHLDTCFCPISEDQAIYFPGAFDEYGLKVIREFIPRLIEVESSEAQQFACNAVVVGTTVVTNTGCPRLHADLRRLGFATRDTQLSEFAKAGGSAKCLTLRLDGEDAALWAAVDHGQPDVVP